MKHLYLIVFPLLLSACAGAVTTVPTATNTPKPPTFTPTITLVPTIMPTAIPPITDLTAWEKSEGDRIAKEAGFASYAEYVQKKLVENPEYDTVNESRVNIAEPYIYVSAEGLVMEQATVPVLSDYWKVKGVEKAEVLLMAFEHTTQPISVLAGFHLSDGTYVSMLPLEVGVDAKNRSQDIILNKPADLKHLVGQLRSVRMIDRLNPGPDYDFDNYAENWNKLKEFPDKNQYYNIFGVRSDLQRSFLEFVLYNESGYIRTMSGIKVINNPPQELTGLMGDKIKDALNNVYVQVYNLTHDGGGADSWMVVLTLGQNGGVISR